MIFRILIKYWIYLTKKIILFDEVALGLHHGLEPGPEPTAGERQMGARHVVREGKEAAQQGEEHGQEGQAKHHSYFFSDEKNFTQD